MPFQLTYLAKPRQGHPCNGCGYCCQQEVCKIGQMILGKLAEAPCSLLIYREGRTFCGAVEGADPVTRPPITSLLGIGRGCCTDNPVEVLEI